MNDNQREEYHDWPEDDSQSSMYAVVWLVGAVLCALGAMLGYALS